MKTYNSTILLSQADDAWARPVALAQNAGTNSADVRGDAGYAGHEDVRVGFSVHPFSVGGTKDSGISAQRFTGKSRHIATSSLQLNARYRFPVKASAIGHKRRVILRRGGHRFSTGCDAVELHARPDSRSLC